MNGQARMRGMMAGAAGRALMAMSVAAAISLTLVAPAGAEQTVIRIEAKRGQDAADQAAARWRAEFDDVVTFPLNGGWVGIALGPMADPAAAAQRLGELRATGAVPGDSFVTGLGDAVPLAGAEGAAVAAPAAPVASGVPAAVMNLDPMGAPPPAAILPSAHIRLEAFQDRAEADAALTRWRETFPGAGLWTLPNGWFGIGIGPMEEDTASAWLGAFKTAGAMPKDAFVAPAADMGAVAMAGSAPDLPAPPDAPADLPPVEDMQRALRWAGHYDGAIDGQSGPGTRAAIAAEIAGARLSPDPGTAMQALFDRRDAWRAEMGLAQLDDAHTGLSVSAPMGRLVFDRTERALSIYGPRDGSGAALILFSQPGGQQEMLDLAGLVTALGWVPSPERVVERGSIRLTGANDAHIGHAEGRVRDGRAEGFVLIWPAGDAQEQARIAAELSESLTRSRPAATDAPAAADSAAAPASATGAAGGQVAPVPPGDPMPLPAN